MRRGIHCVGRAADLSCRQMDGWDAEMRRSGATPTDCCLPALCILAVAIPCKPLLLGPEHGSAGDCAAVVPNGKSCSFTCEAGYELTGKPRICSKGIFKGDMQTCQPMGLSRS